jgi:hypothetical protein
MDLIEIYEIGGLAFKSYIDGIIADDSEMRRKCDVSCITFCVAYLLNLSDDKFEEIYMGMPVNSANYFNKINPKIYLNYYDYIYACISSEYLIRRCLKISALNLNNAITILRVYREDTIPRYLNFDLSSCKLLLHHDYDIISLLLIAHNVNDYESMKHIINYMSVTKLAELLRFALYSRLGIHVILIVDRIINTADKGLILLMTNKIAHEPPQKMSNVFVLMHCYYIIRYASREEGKHLMAKQNEQYDAHTLLIEDKICYNKMLEFHFRPRGGYTKGSSHYVS